ncbi:hypothetical protein OIE62_06695 [Streptomyces scopuliridis]|uniref:Uncharacterized protein n=1 Tax=Streptomyces scopuliridis TaxID=452529 RepID=A0ACD4ZU68_9ACTN|nr:hypothetical protein [Streptomyces scopuliridis]WSC01729.1 hypothetical protein OG835_35125 [Streptomyces scopuliridis]WSC04732.1 hypothetical protein OIE62_06695 [Streptomyces scopuliridis]
MSDAPAAPGLFTVIEGADGSGKSAATRQLVRDLHEQGRTVVTTERSQPYGQQEYADLVRAVGGVFQSGHTLATSFDLLSLAAATQYTAILHGQVETQVAKGAVVIAESWWDKTWIRLGIEAQLCHQHDRAWLEEFWAWQQTLMPPPSLPPPQCLTVLVNTPEADRVHWYEAGGRRDPVYDTQGAISHTPADYGHFTSRIATRLTQLAHERGWPTVTNSRERTVQAVTGDLLTLINNQLTRIRDPDELPSRRRHDTRTTENS